MPIELIHLKQYWYEESILKKPNVKHNELINQIVHKESKDVLLKAFLQRFVEFGDYLFIKHANCFAIMIDHPRPNYDIYSSHYFGIHGFVELIYLCGAQQEALNLFQLVCCFARDILFRKYVTLHLYESHFDFPNWEFDQVTYKEKKTKSGPLLKRFRLLLPSRSLHPKYTTPFEPSTDKIDYSHLFIE